MNLKIIVISLTAGILLVSAYVFSFDYFAAQTEPTEQVFCTQEVMECPDGSWVSRVGQNCEFAACSSESLCEGEECPKQGLGQVDISGWKTYRNEKYGFEVKYPANYSEHFKVQDGLLSQYALDETMSLVTQRKFGSDLITSPVNITIYRNPRDMTAMEWISSNLGNITKMTEDSIVLYGYNRPEKELLIRATFLAKNINPDFIVEVSFELQYFGNLSIYPSDEQYIQTYNQILSTFKFLK